MTRTTTILMTALLLAPAPALAQSAEAAGSAAATATAAANGTPRAPDAPQQDPQARIDAAMEAAAKASIPTSLLESKVEEGRAKRVPMDRVAAAVEARLEALIGARDAFRQAGLDGASEGEMLVAAHALQAGVSQSALVRVTRSAPAERRAVATAVLTDLVRLGYANGRALSRVNAALSSGPESLVNLRAEAAASLRARGQISTGLGLGRKQ